MSTLTRAAESVSGRPFRPEDWPILWPILKATLTRCDTCALAPDSSEGQIHRVWVELPLATYGACALDGTIVGTYRLQAIPPGLGSPVCNCVYVVSRASHRRGVAATRCEPSQRPAVNLGKRVGFQIVGTRPKAFRHRQLGYVDAHVMYKRLAARAEG